MSERIGFVILSHSYPQQLLNSSGRYSKSTIIHRSPVITIFLSVHLLSMSSLQKYDLFCLTSKHVGGNFPSLLRAYVLWIYFTAMRRQIGSYC